MTKFTIAIDIDDCVCNTWEADLNWAYLYAGKNKLKFSAEKLSMKDFRHCEVFKTFDFTSEQTDEFFTEEKAYLMKTTGMFPKYFAAEMINKLKKDGHKIVFLTSRNNAHWGNNAKKYAKKWLKKFKICFDDIVVYGGNKGELCKRENCQILIEDRCENAQAANDCKIKSILLLNEYNQEYKNELNFTATCWAEIYDHIKNLALN